VTQGCMAGSMCSVRALAGGSGNSKAEDYKAFRFLALYLEIELTNQSPNSSLGIKGDGTKSGLILDVIGPNHNGRICLGGRELTKLSNLDGNYFNLRLRGTKDSSGGAEKFNDTECGGDYRLSNILVDRDGSFRPKISLLMSGQQGDRVSGKINLYAFVDSYKPVVQTVPITQTCAPVPFRRNLTLGEAAPSSVECGLTGKETNLTRKLILKTESFVGCSDNSGDQTLIPATATIPQSGSESYSVDSVQTAPREILTAQCNQNFGPLEPSICGWTLIKGSEGNVEVGQLPEDKCFQAKKKEEILNCNEDVQVSSCNVDNLQVNSCRAVEVKAEQLAALESIHGLPIGTSNEFDRKLIRGSSIASKNSCQQEQSKDGSLDCGLLKWKTMSSKPLFKRENPNWRPSTIEEFINNSDEPFCGTINPVDVTLSSAAPEEIEILGYPFDGEKTLEISESKPGLVAGKIQCINDGSPALTLEERLREYSALNGFPETRDPQIKFEFNVKPLGSTTLVSSTSGCITNQFTSVEGCSNLKVANHGSEASEGMVQISPIFEYLKDKDGPAWIRSAGVSKFELHKMGISLPYAGEKLRFDSLSTYTRYTKKGS